MVDLQIDNAIDNEYFTLFYQPKFFSANNTIVGIEALIRLKKDNQIFLPSDFIPNAEKSGEIIKIDKWVLKQISKDVQKIYEETGGKIGLSFNISALHFQNKDLVKDLETLVNTSKNFLSYLAMEITETSLILDINRAKNDIEYLRKLGLKISIDDFGTGYGSFLYISNFPVDIIKCDKSFIDNINIDKRSFAILQSLIFLCAKLKIKLIVEGIENTEQVAILKKLGCYYMQGFFFAKLLNFFQ